PRLRARVASAAVLDAVDGNPRPQRGGRRGLRCRLEVRGLELGAAAGAFAGRVRDPPPADHGGSRRASVDRGRVEWRGGVGERPPAGTARVEGPVAAIGRGRPKLDLQVVTSTAGLDALRSKWSDLHLRTGASVFQSYEWQRTWWAHFGENVNSRSLHIVVLE